MHEESRINGLVRIDASAIWLIGTSRITFAFIRNLTHGTHHFYQKASW